MKYEVVVSANIKTIWDANSEQEAIQMAQDWTAQEYSDLVHRASYEVNNG